MPDSNPLAWITSKSAEWWLGRLGISFLVLAMFFLFRYAVEHNWITPSVRVAAGFLTGAALLVAGFRTRRETKLTASKAVRLRELLLAGAVAIWYITGYAAAIVYQLIPVAGARVWFGLISIAATWIALEEEQEVFALVAILAGFTAPFLLPTPAEPVVAFSIYLAAVAAVGLVLYLMRGWQSLLWVAFAGFWISLTPPYPRPVWTLGQALSLTLLILAAGAAFTRVPALRRRLVVLNPERYRASERSLLSQLRDIAATGATGASEATDSLALWVITLVSPLISLVYLYTVWPNASIRAGGVAAFAIGAVAFMLGLRGEERDPEITQLEMTAGSFYTLLGLVMMTLNAATLPLMAAHAGLSRMLPREQRFHSPRLIARATIAVALGLVIVQATVVAAGSNVRWSWIIGGIISLAIGAGVTALMMAEDERSGASYAVLTFIALLLIANNALGAFWPPLVTVGYAFIGAGLLIAGSRPHARRILRQLGSATMIIVALRLIFVDLASVATIWRVLLFLVCGGLFLLTAYRLQLKPKPTG